MIGFQKRIFFQSRLYLSLLRLYALSYAYTLTRSLRSLCTHFECVYLLVLLLYTSALTVAAYSEIAFQCMRGNNIPCDDVWCCIRASVIYTLPSLYEWHENGDRLLICSIGIANEMRSIPNHFISMFESPKVFIIETLPTTLEIALNFTCIAKSSSDNLFSNFSSFETFIFSINGTYSLDASNVNLNGYHTKWKCEYHKNSNHNKSFCPVLARTHTEIDIFCLCKELSPSIVTHIYSCK